MIEVYPYTNLTDTIAAILLQVKRSVKYCKENFGYFKGQTDEEIFYALKTLVNYKKDPKGDELLQKVETLAKNDFRGDCDCFSILTLSIFLSLGTPKKDLASVLVGKTKKFPSHIYCLVNGKVFDLTNAYFNQERKSYNFRQYLPLNIL